MIERERERYEPEGRLREQGVGKATAASWLAVVVVV